MIVFFWMPNFWMLDKNFTNLPRTQLVPFIRNTETLDLNWFKIFNIWIVYQFKVIYFFITDNYFWWEIFKIIFDTIYHKACIFILQCQKQNKILMRKTNNILKKGPLPLKVKQWIKDEISLKIPWGVIFDKINICYFITWNLFKPIK